MAQVCFDSTTFYTVLIISLAIFVYCLLDVKEPRETTKEVKYVEIAAAAPPVNIFDELESARHYETNRFLHPMIPPLRRGPFNIGPGGASRGRYGYGVFNQMGYLHNPNNIDQAMPLMGRQIHSQQFEYYTFHHNNPDIKIPIKINGDREINDGDPVSLASYENPFKAKIYELDTPRYVPF